MALLTALNREGHETLFGYTGEHSQTWGPGAQPLTARGRLFNPERPTSNHRLRPECLESAPHFPA